MLIYGCEQLMGRWGTTGANDLGFIIDYFGKNGYDGLWILGVT